MMSLFSKSFKALRLVAATALLPLLASCQWMTEDYDVETDVSNPTQYINVTISVSAGNDPVTRSNPTGGEYGDGSETGIDERENKVNNITLIFYQDDGTPDKGINTTSTTAKVACVKTYVVHRYTSDDKLPINHDHTKLGNITEPDDVQEGEILYTTGDQALKDTHLQAGQKYHVIVVANTTVDVNEGDYVKDVRQKVLTSLYEGTGKGVNATNFVMASESDAIVELKDPYVYTSTTVPEDNRFVYYFNCIHIERLAARLDFWAKGSNGYKTSSDNAAYTTSGYEYTVKKPNGDATADRFVLTSITPFNLNNGNEYILKRVTTGFSEGTTPVWLGEETTSNWVVDPSTSMKNSTTAHPTDMVSTLTSVIGTHNNEYNVTMAGEQSNKIEIQSNDNIIVGYAKENTLKPDVTSLYYYATGLAFEGYYYSGGTGTGTRCVFYHFIRHQGESNSAYQAFTSANINTDATKAIVCPTTPAMNYGIVRNNIYRISIDKVSALGGVIKITIEEKHWRHVDNPVIYI